MGPVKVESLPCCIHFVASYAPYTFACAYALKNGIKIHFGSDAKIKSRRIAQYAKVSSSKYTNSLEVKNEKELDKELMGWLKQAYNLKRSK